MNKTPVFIASAALLLWSEIAMAQCRSVPPAAYVPNVDVSGKPVAGAFYEDPQQHTLQVPDVLSFSVMKKGKELGVEKNPQGELSIGTVTIDRHTGSTSFEGQPLGQNELPPCP